MKNQKGISMIALIITIIVIIILAAIVFIASGDTMGKAQLSVFEQEFGDFAMNFKNDPLANLQLLYGQAGQAKTTAQLVYEVVTGTPAAAGTIVPAGYSYTGKMGTLYRNGTAAAIKDTIFGDSTGAAYATYCITDESVVEGYKEHEKFYGDNLGEELHFVTQNGDVFTLPGYPTTALCGTEEKNVFYVTTDLYYEAGENYENAVFGVKTNGATGNSGDGVFVPAKTSARSGS